MRKFIQLIESNQRAYYHVGMEYLPIGTILTPRGSDYANDWSITSFYSILEKYRPHDCLAHSQAVFMIGDIDDADLIGGNYIMTVEPLSEVQRHDMNWSGEIDRLVETYGPNSDQVEQAAIRYWNVEPSGGEILWEYLTSSARVVDVQDF